jgi:hypothetical protein
MRLKRYELEAVQRREVRRTSGIFGIHAANRGAKSMRRSFRDDPEHLRHWNIYLTHSLILLLAFAAVTK